MNRRSSIRWLLPLGFVLVALGPCEPPSPAPEIPAAFQARVGAFELSFHPQTTVRISRSVFRFGYEVEVSNSGPAALDVQAIGTSASSTTTVTQGALAFGDVARHARAKGTPLFELEHDRAVPFDPAALRWHAAAEVARDAAGYEIDPPGQWISGDLHVHATGASNDTGSSQDGGGNSFPENIKAVALQRGLGFVVLTDHSNSTGSDPSTTAEDPALFNRGPEFPYWDLAADLSSPGEFLMIDGNELSPRKPNSDPTGHVHCIPSNLATFDRDGAFIDRPFGAVTGAQTLAQARARGCFVVLAHPFAILSHIAFDWTSFDYDAIEVWNGGVGFGFGPNEQAAHAAWKCDLVAGRDVAPLGTSDNHRVYMPEPAGGLGNPALGTPRTTVFARDFTWDGILDGLRAGHVTVHEGTSRLWLDPYDSDRTLTSGKAIRRFRLRGTLDPRSQPATLVLVRTTACVDPRPQPIPPTPTETTLLETPIAPSANFDLEIAVEGESGVYTATLLPPEDIPRRYGALSRAVVIP